MEKKALTARINLLFGILCLPFAVQIFASSLLGSLWWLPMGEYVRRVLLPQILYPLLVGLLALTVVRIERIPLNDWSVPSLTVGQAMPWFGLFLGGVTVGNYLNNALLSALRAAGLILPDVFADADPTTGGEALWFFVAMAILPALSEELLFRGLTVGGLGQVHPMGSVVLSAFAFAMMHATLQQIPFALFMGLLFGFVYRKTGRLIYPVLMHFINNARACLITFLRVFHSPLLAAQVGTVSDLVFLAFGVWGLVCLIRRKELSLPPPGEEGRGLWQAVLSSVGFWAFTLLYLGLTLLRLKAGE